MRKTFQQGRGDTEAPDQPVTPQQIGSGASGAGGDFVFAVYTQLAQIQRDLGSLTAVQSKLAEQLKESEARVVDRSKDSEARVIAHVEKTEKTLGDRLKSAEDKVSGVKENVNKVIWMGAGIGIVLGVVIGWKPIFAKVLEMAAGSS